MRMSFGVRRQVTVTCVFRLLEEILRYIHSVARCVEANADKPAAKFWRVLLNKSYDVLDKVSFCPRRR